MAAVPPSVGAVAEAPPFPYKKTFVEATPQALLDNLRNDELFPTLIEEKRNDQQPLPYELFTHQPGYRSVNIITDLFTEDARVQARLHGQLSPLEFWKLNHVAVKERSQRDMATTENPIDNYALRLTLSLMCKEATSFSPLLSRKVYDLLLPEQGGCVLDPFSGWGDRAIGALGSKKVQSYDGVDCNTALVPGYQRIVQELDVDHKLRFHLTPWQLFRPPRAAYDLIFTSPPYFDFEIYSSEPTQSHAGQATYQDWWNNFMQHALRKMRVLLQPGGYLAIHIGHTYRTPTFTEDVKTLLTSEACGLRFVQAIECLTFNKTRPRPTRPICLYVYQAPSAVSPGSASPDGTAEGETPAAKRTRVN